MRGARALLSAAVLALASCDDPAPGALTQCQDSFVLPAAARTDILFVIDDSGSMSEEQANVRNNLTQFIQALDASPIALDYQIGVTNASVVGYSPTSTTYLAGPNTGIGYPAGRLVAVSPSGVYSYTDPKRVLSSSSPTLVTDFQANVLVGTDGTGKEQPFRAARLALAAAVPSGANDGFLRAGARLAIVFVSDEDDCSDVSGDVTTADGCLAKAPLDPVSDLVSFLRGPIAGETREVVVAAIVGLDTATLQPSCGDPANLACEDPPGPTTCTTAYDRGDRFVSLLDALGSAATVRDSVCDTSFAGSLEAIAGLIVPDTMPLEGAPADWRMLAVTVTKATGATVACEVAPFDAPTATADALYTPPQAGGPATLTFQGDCALLQGDRVDVGIVCAG